MQKRNSGNQDHARLSQIQLPSGPSAFLPTLHFYWPLIALDFGHDVLNLIPANSGCCGAFEGIKPHFRSNKHQMLIAWPLIQPQPCFPVLRQSDRTFPGGTDFRILSGGGKQTPVTLVAAPPVSVTPPSASGTP